MNTAKTYFLIMLLAIGLGCGYSKPKTTMPAIATLDPASTTAGSGQFQLEVDGSNFATGAVVTFNGTPEATTVVSSTKLEATIPASAIMTSGRVSVTVTNPGSGGIYGGMGSVTSAPMNFMIN
jgi:hypothetical protein